MALTEKQKKIILMGTSISKRRGASKDFLDIVEGNIKGTVLTNFVSALKNELVAMKTARKTNITKEISDLNS